MSKKWHMIVALIDCCFAGLNLNGYLHTGSYVSLACFIALAYFGFVEIGRFFEKEENESKEM